MCSGPKSPASPPPPPPSAAKAAPEAAQPHPASSLLLELAASDDLPAFRNAVQNLNLSPSAPAPWYSRSPATRRMSLEPRTPLHIAALYGSTSVLRYLLPLLPASHASLPSGTDQLTPLHLAAAGGAGTAVITILLSAGADPEALDSAGHRPAELIQRNNTMSKTPNNKLTYSLDINLPDIKTGVYSTDEFRIYTFKVKPCSRAYSHDWTECPFVHPGENARRRDPRKFLYSSIPCPEFRKSAACRNGDGCEYAHGVFESWLHPAQYRTRLCKDETGCNRRVCFFAHKVEELRTVNQTGGLSMPMPSSPRSPSVDMAAAMMLMQQQQQQVPMSPSSLQLPSRLKASLAGRDIDFDSMDLRGLEGYLSSPRSSPSSNLSSNLRVNAMAAASRAADYSELLGAMDRSVISGLSMQQTATVAAQYQSMNSGYGSSSLGMDHSTAKAIMNSRASAFAKRSQSFVDRGAVGRSMVGAPVANTASGWGSPSGKLDWGIQGDELNKLRKSASFAIRSSNNASGFPAQVFDEPDVSWVHSLVKDGPVMARPVGQAQHQYHHGDMLSPWAEQEQTVA